MLCACKISTQEITNNLSLISILHIHIQGASLMADDSKAWDSIDEPVGTTTSSFSSGDAEDPDDDAVR